MRIGMGDVTSCGENPCGLTDYVYVSTPCCHYLQCADPGDARIVNLDANCNAIPILPQVGTEIGQTVGNAVGAAIGGAASTAAGQTGYIPLVIGGVAILAALVLVLRK